VSEQPPPGFRPDMSLEDIITAIRNRYASLPQSQTATFLGALSFVAFAPLRAISVAAENTK